MLVSLSIQNYALIRQLEISFGPGLHVLTGETGAGKSILLGALGLVLGERASLEVILDRERKCVVECEADISSLDLKDFFAANDIDFDGQCIIRREITPTGKSRAFVNDTPVTLDVLRELGLSLVEIHSQHSTISLNRPLVQLSILDDWSGLSNRVRAYAGLYQQWKDAQHELESLRASHEKAMADQEFLLAQVAELKAAACQPGEKQALLAELSVLEHSEEIMQTLAELDALMNEEEGGISSGLHKASQRLQRLASRSADFEGLAARIESSVIEVRDIAAELGKAADSLDVSPERLAMLRERLDLINHLEHKHGIMEEDGLIHQLTMLEGRLSDLSAGTARILGLEKEVRGLYDRVISEAGAISQARKDGAITLRKAVLRSLAETGLQDAAFEVKTESDKVPGLQGIDAVTFLFAAHQGNPLGELGRIASGGELARIMLAIKANISEKRLLPTIIFDEIDSGISGATASLVGRLMNSIGRKMQVMVITHQPSIAGFGDSHYLVFKEKELTFIHSRIKKLSDNERVEVLAGMISGGEPTAASREAAGELLRNRLKD